MQAHVHSDDKCPSKRLGPNIMLPAMLTLWGIVTTMHGEPFSQLTMEAVTDAHSSGFVHSYSGLLACRFFLGLCEGMPQDSGRSASNTMLDRWTSTWPVLVPLDVLPP